MGNLISISDNTTLIGADPPATVRAPEIEAGVGCDFDSYLLVPDNTLDDRIAAAKARLRNDVVILGHRSEEHTSELQSQSNLVCRLLLEKKKKEQISNTCT